VTASEDTNGPGTAQLVSEPDSTTQQFYGFDDSGYSNVISNDGKTALDIIAANGVHVGSSDCFFEGTIIG
jgi:hypothetical protein